MWLSQQIHRLSFGSPFIPFVLILLLPLFITSNYVLSMLILIGLYALVCNGLTLLMGFAGQISLGHAAFYGIGAYLSAILSATYDISPWIAMIIGALVASVIAFIVGIPTFKLNGHYLALATLGFGIIVYTAFKELSQWTGGLNGFFGIPSLSFLGIELNNDFRYYYLVWLFVMIGLLFSRNVLRSRVGRALRSIEGSEAAADAIGINIMKYKLQVFVLSAIFASFSGSLYAHYVTFINPNLFEAMTSIHFLIMVVIGGAGSIWGSVIGAGAFVILGEGLKSVVPIIFPNAGGEFEIVFFGILLVVVLIFMPKGLSQLLTRGSIQNQYAVSSIPSSDSKSLESGGDRS